METGVIEIWNQLITSTISPEEILRQKPDQKTIDLYVEVSAKAKREMQSFLLTEVFSKNNDEELSYLIVRCQAFLTCMSDVLFRYGKQDITQPIKKVYKRIDEDLQEIIEFLQTHFIKYFSPDEKVPESRVALIKLEIENRLPEIRKYLQAKSTDEELTNCVVEVIEEFKNGNANAQITYRCLRYVMNLLQTLDKPGPSFIYKYSETAALLIFLNFNDLTFSTYIFQKLSNGLSTLETAQEKIEELRAYHKHTSQISIKPDTALHFGQPSIKDLILAWLDQELFFWESSNSEQKPSSPATSIKINTSVSVPVLALFTRLFKDAGIVTNPNHAELLRFLSSHFTSQRKAGISYGHLHSKYYQIEESTKRKVYDILINMANLCKKLG